MKLPDDVMLFANTQRMSKSHVSGGFWLGGFSSVPAFRAELPNETTEMVFEHRGKHWGVWWLIESSGFSGKWRCAGACMHARGPPGEQGRFSGAESVPRRAEWE